MAYFLVADHGSDPIMLDVLGVKKQQLDGIIDPKGELVQTNELQEQYIRELAKDFLHKNGVIIDENSDGTNITSDEASSDSSGVGHDSQLGFSLRSDVREHDEGVVGLSEGALLADQSVQPDGE